MKQVFYLIDTTILYKVIDMAGKILARASADELARAAYQQRRKWYLDRVSSEKYLLHKGIEEGRAKGIEEGKKEIAKKLLAMDLPIDNIEAATGLNRQEIEAMRNNQ